MKITRQKNQQAKLELTFHDLEVLRNIFTEVEKSLGKYEFETRVDWSRQQAIIFLESLALQSRSSSEYENSINILCSSDEVKLINNLLNEVCNGIRIDDFENKIGLSEKEVRYLLRLVSKVNKEMYFIEEWRKDLHFQHRFTFPIAEYDCCFEADGYEATFHIKKLTSLTNENNVGLLISLDFTYSSYVEFSIKSTPKTLPIENLYDFIERFERYMALSKKELQELALPFEIFKSNLFQVYALARDVTSDGEEYVTINFILSLAETTVIVQPFTGVQGAITVEKVRNFISSMRSILTELS